MRKVLPLVLMASLSACATVDAANRDPRDPYEGFNRGVWAFNQAADQVVVKPVTQVYRAIIPKFARRGVSGVFSNLTEPVSFLNNLLQGKPDRAFNSLGRFLVNSTVGIAGLADPASKMGMKPTPEDYGQTFAKSLGARKSPYLVLPLLGPSTLRDAAGTAVNFAVNPLQIVLSEVGAGTTERVAVTALNVVDGRSQAMDAGFDGLLESSADPYAAARSAYLQRREAQIEDRENADATLAPEEEQELLNRALQDDGAAPAPADPADAVPPTSVKEGAAPPADTPIDPAPEPELAPEAEAEAAPDLARLTVAPEVLAMDGVEIG